jgi:AbrB family looped-hinge helix DNA binding protein
MKIGERGQVTIPKGIRDRFGLKPRSEVEFHTESGHIILKKKARKLKLEKWRGRCKPNLAKLGIGSVDRFIEEVRGR